VPLHVPFIGLLGGQNLFIGILMRAKNWLSYLIYSNLLQAPQKGQIVADRVSGEIDKDYVVMLYQIRRYLYGELSESQLRKYMARQTPLMKYHGLMSFYPIVDDERLLKELDGWLIGSGHRALQLRARLLGRAGIPTLPQPHGMSSCSRYGTRREPVPYAIFGFLASLG
jgi:RNA-directed DNA polymerase